VIPFQTWLSQMLGYCHFVIDTLGVRRAWVSKDYSQTSITNFDELYEQIFDDLDSDRLEERLNVYLRDNPELREALAAFLQELRAISDQRDRIRKLASDSTLLESEEWSRVVEIAWRVVRGSPISVLGKDEVGG
jgi:hypothetical protein